MNSKIRRYMQENQCGYTNEAISRCLLDAGHDSAETAGLSGALTLLVLVPVMLLVIVARVSIAGVVPV